MPELPEVEILVRHLAPLLRSRTVRDVCVNRPKVLAPTTPVELKRKLIGARFVNVSRRGKFLVFELSRSHRRGEIQLIGHLGMTGRMYLQSKTESCPKHASVVLDLGRHNFVFEDPRYFGRLTFCANSIAELGPEPLSDKFDVDSFAAGLRRSGQAIKIRLLDQKLVAGIGNIYASEALFRARISPRTASRRLSRKQVEALWSAIRDTLAEAIRFGSTVPLMLVAGKAKDRLFYFGRQEGAADFYEERLMVYDRAGQPCRLCGETIRRLVQAARSTYYCPKCQR